MTVELKAINTNDIFTLEYVKNMTKVSNDIEVTFINGDKHTYLNVEVVVLNNE